MDAMASNSEEHGVAVPGGPVLNPDGGLSAEGEDASGPVEEGATGEFVGGDAALLERVNRFFQQQEWSLAGSLCDELARRHPDSPRILSLQGVVALQTAQYGRATHLLSRASVMRPDSPFILCALGHALMAREKFDAALARYHDVLKLDPDQLEAIFNIASIHHHRKQYSEAIKYYQRMLTLRFDLEAAHMGISNSYSASGFALISGIHLQLYHHFNGSEAENSQEHLDAFFVDARQAVETARQNNRVFQTVAVTGCQVCYTDGEPSADDPPNLVRLPMDGLDEFFFRTRWRFPDRVVFDPNQVDSISRAMNVAMRLDFVRLGRSARFPMMIKACRSLRLEFTSDKPLRILCPASRLTTVMQYSSSNLARAFARLGCESRLLLERNDMEQQSADHIIQDQVAFNPHVVININHLNNHHLSPGVFNITWWQDPMPEILGRQPLPWRERDLVFSAYPQFDPLLAACGANRIHRQGFCADLEIFKMVRPREDRNKIVFVGEGYGLDLRFQGREFETWQRLERDGGVPESHQAGVDGFDGTQEEQERVYSVTRVLRATSVAWFCRLGRELGWEVEVYGRNWENNPEVKPFYKGELSHGPDVAAVYNEARYALCVNPWLVNSQRLVEVAACGAIPVVFDARAHADDPPHWDEECLFFKTRDDLKKCLQSAPAGDPLQIPPHYSYDRFAQRILDMIHDHLRQETGG